MNDNTKIYESTCAGMRFTFRQLPREVQENLLAQLTSIKNGTYMEDFYPEDQMGTALAGRATEDDLK